MTLVLDDWQQQVLAYEGDILLCTGRRVGKTQIMAIKAAEYLVSHPNHQIIIASLTEDQAKLIIVMILDYLERNYKSDIAKGKNKPTQNKVTLKNKASALARPVGTTGDAIRGFNGNVLILDEVSRFGELILTAATPVLLTTGGQIWMCSTPYGKQGYFWEQFNKAYNKQEPDARFKVFYKTSEQVVYERQISESWTENQRAKAINFLEEERKDKSELVFAQEYLGLFMEELRQFFSDELIEQCCTLQRNPQQRGEKYLGVDIARFGDDESSFELIAKDQKNYVHIESIVTKKTYTTETEAKIIELDKMYDFAKIGIDAGSGSLGVGIFDHLRVQPTMKKKVEPMNNRALAMDRDGKQKQRMMKEDFYDNLKSMMEHGELKLLNDEKVRLSLKSVQWEFTKVMPNDPDSEDTTSKVRIFGKYTHIVEGLTRAAWLAKKTKSININLYYM